MVAFEIILDCELPVGSDRIKFAMRDLGVCPPVGAVGGVQRGFGVAEIERMFGEGDQHEAFDHAQMDRFQPVRLGVEIARHVAGRAQRTVEIIGPGVIGTHQHARPALALQANARAAMPADVGESAQSLVLPADDDDRLFGHLVEEIVAGVRREALVSRAQPVAEEQPLDVGLENLGIVVEGLSQRMIGRLPHAESGDAVVDGFGGNVDVHDQLVYHACSGGGRPAVARDRVLPNSGCCNSHAARYLAHQAASNRRRWSSGRIGSPCRQILRPSESSNSSKARTCSGILRLTTSRSSPRAFASGNSRRAKWCSRAETRGLISTWWRRDRSGSRSQPARAASSVSKSSGRALSSAKLPCSTTCRAAPKRPRSCERQSMVSSEMFFTAFVTEAPAFPTSSSRSCARGFAMSAIGSKTWRSIRSTFVWRGFSCWRSEIARPRRDGGFPSSFDIPKVNWRCSSAPAAPRSTLRLLRSRAREPWGARRTGCSAIAPNSL